MSILDEQKTPEQLRGEEIQRDEEFIRVSQEAFRRMHPHGSGMVVTTLYKPGRKPRRYYSRTVTV
jgi:hypothetical protein